MLSSGSFTTLHIKKTCLHISNLKTLTNNKVCLDQERTQDGNQIRTRLWMPRVHKAENFLKVNPLILGPFHPAKTLSEQCNIASIIKYKHPSCKIYTRIMINNSKRFTRIIWICTVSRRHPLVHKGRTVWLYPHARIRSNSILDCSTLRPPRPLSPTHQKQNVNYTDQPFEIKPHIGKRRFTTLS